MCISVFTVALLTLSRAQDCPQVDLITNFDLVSYAQGTWYEKARYANSLENNTSCLIANYTKRGDNDYVIEVSEVQNGKRIVYDGLLDLSTDDHLKGVVNYVFLIGKTRYRIAMTFLAIDYNSYSIKYTCMTDPKRKRRIELAWIYSRTKQLTDSAKAAIDSYLSSSKLLDRSKFFWDAFSDDSCNSPTAMSPELYE